MSKQTSGSNHRYWIALAAFALFAVALIYANAIWINLPDPTERGQFGDMFGGLNVIFSGLAFIGLVSAILLQREDLKVQSEILEATQKELKGQKEALQKQASHLDLQHIENQFFQLLSLLQNTVEAIEFNPASGKVTGKAFFAYFSHELSQTIPELHQFKSGEITTAVGHYDQLYKAHAPRLGHYFRVLYNCVKQIAENNIENQVFYTNVIRAQMSNDEASILFFNCLSNNGVEKFKKLCEDFSLLKNIESHFVYSWADFDAYAPTAYGSNYYDLVRAIENRLGPRPA